jgi:hypothetical protein
VCSCVFCEQHKARFRGKDARSLCVRIAYLASTTPTRSPAFASNSSEFTSAKGERMLIIIVLVRVSFAKVKLWGGRTHQR